MKKNKSYITKLLKDKPLVTIQNAHIGDKVIFAEMTAKGVVRLVTGVIEAPGKHSMRACNENPAVFATKVGKDSVYCITIAWDKAFEIIPETKIFRSNSYKLAAGDVFHLANNSNTRLYKSVSIISEDQKTYVHDLVKNLSKIGQI